MPQISTFAEAQDLLRPLYQNARTLYNLDNMRALMALLDNPQNKLRIIHIAGTSGKTSTAYYIAALLSAQKLQVGLTVSPHVDHINERLQFNGQPLAEAAYCGRLGELMDLITQSNLKPSYFEVLTALSFWECARRQVDYLVMEVGMGGEMDATNVIDCADKVCVITDIGLDHTEILGDTLDKIAWYKAGIIQPENQVFMYRQGQEVMEVVEAAAKRNQAVLHVGSDDEAVVIPKLPLFQQRNLGLARHAVDYVNQRDGRSAVTDEALAAAAAVQVPARLERFQVGEQVVILDGSHNQQKMHALLESVAALYPEQSVAVLASFVAGNDTRWQEALGELLPVASHVIFTSFHSEKDYPKSSVDPQGVADYCQAQGFTDYEVEADPKQAYAVLGHRPESVLLVTGSFYLMNHIRPLVAEVAV